jgi:hypothetical protein
VAGKELGVAKQRDDGGLSIRRACSKVDYARMIAADIVEILACLKYESAPFTNLSDIAILLVC